MRAFLTTALLSATITCILVAGEQLRFVTYSRVAILSTGHPTNEFLRARLVSIATNGTTRIQVLSTGEIIEAAVGAPFVGTTGYGKLGVRLTSASHAKGEARLVYMLCEGTP